MRQDVISKRHQSLKDRRVSVTPVIAVSGEEASTKSAALCEQAAAVNFDLMQPASPTGMFFGPNGLNGLNEAERERTRTNMRRNIGEPNRNPESRVIRVTRGNLTAGLAAVVAT
jgi:hypothetical protein